MVGLEGNAEVDRGAVRGKTEVHPVARGSVPRVFDTHVTQT